MRLSAEGRPGTGGTNGKAPPMLLDRKDCFLLIVDIQERLAPAVVQCE